MLYIRRLKDDKYYGLTYYTCPNCGAVAGFNITAPEYCKLCITKLPEITGMLEGDLKNEIEFHCNGGKDENK